MLLRTDRHLTVSPIRASALALTFALLAGCGGEEEATVQAPEVVVATPEIRDVPMVGLFTGSTRATNSVGIRARVSGTLDRMYFEPGAQVDAGEVLFLIQPEFYEAIRDEARASLDAAHAESDRAQSELNRLEQALETNAVSEADVERARAIRDQAIASVGAAEARLVRAELDVTYTRVRSPIKGVAGRNLVDLDNLVGAGEPTLLTTVNAIDPIYVYFNAPEQAVLRFLAEAGDRLASEVGGPVAEIPQLDREAVDTTDFVGKVQVATAEDEGFPHPGYLDFIDNTVDPATGTIELRATLPNEDLQLFPGLFVRIRVLGGTTEDAVLIREEALGRDLGGPFVLVVGPNDIVERRYVEPGALQDDGMRVVTEGLDGTERYIVSGLLRARPGMPVTPVAEGEAGGEPGIGESSEPGA